MIARGDRPFKPWETWVLSNVPGALRLYRAFLWGVAELMLYPVMRRHPALAKLYTKWAMDNLETNVADPTLRKQLTPDYPIGGKRILISDDYYQTLRKPHVELVTDGIDHLTGDAVVTSRGRAIPVDAVVLATGFQTTDFLAPMHVEGKGARLLEKDWQDGPRSYLGISVAGYPNFFMTYGPNTNLGHNSIIFMIECQTRYIVDAIRQLAQRGLAWIDVRRDTMEGFDRMLQAELEHTVWAETPRSWYKNAAGRITNNWSGTTAEYWWRTRRADLGVYDCEAER